MNLSELSLTNMLLAIPIWRRLLTQFACVAFNFVRASAGTRIAARIAIIAITTSNSMSVKPQEDDFLFGVVFIRISTLCEPDRKTHPLEHRTSEHMSPS